MCAPSSSGSGRNSATSTPLLRISRIIRGSATAGAIRMGSNWRARLDSWTQALAIKIILLAAVFLLVPIIFYRLFQIADAQQTELLARTVEQKGTLIATMLRPHLERFQDEPTDELQRALNEVATDGSNIKILVRPEESALSTGFLYVMSAPAVSADYLAEERRSLIEIGVLDRLAPTCDGRADPTVRFTNPA